MYKSLSKREMVFSRDMVMILLEDFISISIITQVLLELFYTL